MSLELVSRSCCIRAAHPSTLSISIRRMRSSPPASRSGSLLAALPRSMAAVTVPRSRPSVRSCLVATPAMAFVLAGPAIPLVPLWHPSTVASATSSPIPSATAACQARTLSAAAPRVVSRSVSRGLATAAHPNAAARGMATVAVNSWAATRTALDGGGNAWRQGLGGGRDFATSTAGLLCGERRATTGGGGDGGRRGGDDGGGRGTPSFPLVTHYRSGASAKKRWRRSRRSTAAKTRRAIGRGSSRSTKDGGGDEDTLPIVSPSPDRPVVAPTAAEAVCVSDKLCAEVERLLGYRFKSQATLREAMSHSSLVEGIRLAPGLRTRNNERLEWLGDCALNLACAHFLHTRLPDHAEGELSRFHSAIISRAACASYAATLGLGGYLHVGLCWRPGSDTMTGNFFEALLGALFVDGGWEAVDAFFTSHLEPLIVERLRSPPQNYRSILLKYASARGQRLEFGLTAEAASAGEAADRDRGNGSDSDGGSGSMVYRLVDGATFDSVAAADGAGFHRRAMLDGEEVGAGWGRTRKAADMAAAEDACHRLRAQGCPIPEQSGVDLRRNVAPNEEV